MRGARARRHTLGRGVLALILLGAAQAPTAFVLRALGLGDLLTGVPALRALRAALPEHRIVLAAPRWQAPLLRPDRLVDEIHQASGLQPLRRAAAAPALAVNLHGRGPQSHLLLASLIPEAWIAFGSTEAKVTGPHWRADEHERERWCRLIRTSADVDADPDDVTLTPPPAAALIENAVIIHPGAAHPSRRWPADRFADLVRTLHGDGLRVVLTGTGPERPMALEVAERAGLPENAVLAGRTRIDELAALVAGAGLVVSGDTGIAHLAGAYRTPSVTIFGPVSPQLWGPPPAGPHTVIWHGTDPGDPWGETIDPALARVSVQEVEAAARGRLNSAF